MMDNNNYVDKVNVKHGLAKTCQVFEVIMKKQTFSIPDMTCSNCAMKLEALEDVLDGVKQIDASYHKLQMVIEYDEAKLTEDQIVAAVKKKGYNAIPV
jgi:copper chaperone CopZ